MSLSCSCEWDGDGWFYTPASDFEPLNRKRSRKCCSCGGKIAVGDDSVKFRRFRGPNSDIEERICGDEIEIATYFMCEECGGLYFSLVELGYCVQLSDGENMRDLVKQRGEDL